MYIFEVREKILNGFKSGIYPLPPIEGTGRPSDFASCLKIVTPKLMFQRLPTALAKVKQVIHLKTC